MHLLALQQVPKAAKVAIRAATQAGRRDVADSGVHGDIFPRSTEATAAAVQRAGKRTWQRKGPSRQGKMTQFGNRMTEKRAAALHLSRVTTMAALGQSPSEASSVWESRHAEHATPGMKHYPLSHHKIVEKYLPMLETKCEFEQLANAGKQPSDLMSTVAFDGLKCGRRKITIITVSTGTVDTLASLDSAVADDAVDTERSLKVVNRVVKKHALESGRFVTLVSSDNAETFSTKLIAQGLTKSQQLSKQEQGKQPVDCTQGTIVHVGRDISHTVELSASDIVNAGVEGIDKYFKEVKSVITWSLTPAVAGHRANVLNDNPDLKSETGEAPSVPLNDLRQSYHEIMLEGNDGSGGLLGNMNCYRAMVQTPAFEDMVETLSRAQKKRFQSMINFIQSNSWLRKGKCLASLLRPIHCCTQILSNEDTPMSAVYPAVYALQAELRLCLVDQADDFDQSFGDGAADALMVAMRRRFNLGGEVPVDDRQSGQRGRAKVPILDAYHIHAWLMDPFAADCAFSIELPHAHHHQAMIKACTTFHNPDDLTNLQKAAIDNRRAQLAQEAMSMHQRTGEYGDAGLGLAPWQINSAVKPTVLAVHDWIQKTGGFASRHGWYAYWKPTSLLYRHCGRPLMSMRSVMSMTCERFAKPLKHVIYGLNRHNTSISHAESLLKCHLMLKMQMQRSLGTASAEAQSRLERARRAEDQSLSTTYGEW